MATLGTANIYSCTNLVTGYTSTATAAGTTTLNSLSSYQQYFTGTTTQTVRLPVVTTLVNGQSYQIVNLSTGVVSVQTGGGTAITTVSAAMSTIFTCSNTGSDVPGSWRFGTTSASVTLNGDVTGDSANNTVGKINTQPISASSGTGSIFWGYSGTVPTTTSSIGIGYQALNVCTATNTNLSSFINVASGANVGIGYQSLAACTTGGGNTACGYQTLQSLTTGVGHTAIGYQAARLLTSSGASSALGYQALANGTTSVFNNVAGYQALSGSSVTGSSYNVGTASQSALAVTGSSTNWSFEVGSQTWINYSSGGARMPVRTTSINNATSITTQRPVVIASTSYALTYGTQYYSVNKASQSGTTVTGTGTSFTPAMVGGTLTYFGSFYTNNTNSAASQTGTTITAVGGSPMFTASMVPGYIVYSNGYSLSSFASQTGDIVTTTNSFLASLVGGYILWGFPNTEVSYVIEYLTPQTVRVAESRTIASSNYALFNSTGTTGGALVTGFVNATTLTTAAVSSQTVGNSAFILFYNNGAPTTITGVSSSTSLSVATSQTIASCTYMIQYSGGANCVFGYQSGLQNYFGSSNVSFGEQTMNNLSIMSNNTAFGYQALGGIYQNVGTVIMSGTVTGFGTNFTPDMIGGDIQIPNGFVISKLTDWQSATSMTTNSTYNISPDQPYKIYPRQENNVAFGAVLNNSSGSNKSTIFGVTSSYATATYTLGTASASGTTVTGVGTRWNRSWDLTDASIRFTTGNLSFAFIASVNSDTSLTLRTSITESAGQFYIIYLPNVPTAIFVGSNLSKNTGTYSVGTASQSALVVTGSGTTWQIEPETWIHYSSGGASMPIEIRTLNSPTSLAAINPVTIASTSYTLSFGEIYSVNRASQSGTVVTGTGTNFTQDMIGGTLTMFGTHYTVGGLASVSGTTITASLASFTASMAPGYMFFFDFYAAAPGLGSYQIGNIITSISSGPFVPADVGMYVLWGGSYTNISYIVEYISAFQVRVLTSETIGSPSSPIGITRAWINRNAALVTGFVNSTTLTAATPSSQTTTNKGWILFYNNGAPTTITDVTSSTTLTVSPSRTIASCPYMIQTSNGRITGCNNTIIGGFKSSLNTVNSGDGGYVILADTAGTPKLTIAPNVCHALNLPTTINASTYTQQPTDSSLVFTTTNCTLTLLDPALYVGAVLNLTNITANSVTCAGFNVVPMASTTPTGSFVILTATAGKYATIQSDGTNWNVIMSN